MWDIVCLRTPMAETIFICLEIDFLYRHLSLYATMQYFIWFILAILFSAHFGRLQTLDRTSPKEALPSEDEWMAFLNLSPERSNSEQGQKPNQHRTAHQEESTAQTFINANQDPIDHQAQAQKQINEDRIARRRKRYKIEKDKFNALPHDQKLPKLQRKRARQKLYYIKKKEENGFPTKHAAFLSEIRSLASSGQASAEQLAIIDKEKEYQHSYYLKRKAQGVKKFKRKKAVKETRAKP